MVDKFVWTYTLGPRKGERRSDLMGWSECFINAWCKREKRAA
jgi:hypothetical protein